MKRMWMAVLLLLLACTACTPQGEPRECITRDALANLDKLEKFIGEYRGQFVDREHEGYRALERLFDWQVQYADLRTPLRDTIYFSAMPEMTRALCYCPDDRLVIDDSHVVTAARDHIRVEGIGAGAQGYVECTRIAENWFYIDAYYPT